MPAAHFRRQPYVYEDFFQVTPKLRTPQIAKKFAAINGLVKDGSKAVYLTKGGERIQFACNKDSFEVRQMQSDVDMVVCYNAKIDEFRAFALHDLDLGEPTRSSVENGTPERQATIKPGRTGKLIK